MSPRAACRLELLGFTQVYDDVAGKADWLAHGLPTEGEQAQVPRVKDILPSLPAEVAILRVLTAADAMKRSSRLPGAGGSQL